MPIYEYRCEKCGEFEQSQRITDPPLQRCPTCKRKVRRLISSTSFQLKGSGWYVTDYARSGKRKEKEKQKDGGDSSASKGGDSSGKGEASSSGKSDGGGKTSGSTKAASAA